MVNNEILVYALGKLKDQVEKSQCYVSQSKKYELNLENGEMSLLRTTLDNTFGITIINNHKKGNITLNKTDTQSVDDAIISIIDICESSEVDTAFDIAPFQQSKVFALGDQAPDLDKMYDLLNQYAKEVKDKYPTIKLMDTAISFTLTKKYLMNSNGVDFTEALGTYNFSSVFAAKSGNKSSSFNYSGYYLRQLENDLLSYGSINKVLKETTEQIETNCIEGKFKGEVILSPDCMGEFISNYINTYLTDVPLISKTSLLKDKLNEQVANPIFTLHSKPRSEKITKGYNITGDGFEAEDMTIIDKGRLNSFVLSLYGANKTGLERSKNTGGCFIVDPGETSIEEMIKSVDKGVLVNRVSGGHPNDNGDLSVVLKNSYYIEHGEIKFPLNETMISLNLNEAFKNINQVSKETIDFGSDIFPYVKVKDVLISGK